MPSVFSIFSGSIRSGSSGNCLASETLYASVSAMPQAGILALTEENMEIFNAANEAGSPSPCGCGHGSTVTGPSPASPSRAAIVATAVTNLRLRLGLYFLLSRPWPRAPAPKMKSLIGRVVHEGRRPRPYEALKLLQKVASVVEPIMRSHNWYVGSLQEFFPSEDGLLGDNFNRGERIRVRLRDPDDIKQFLPLEEVVDIMLHELSHIVYGPHDDKFHALWDQLRDETEILKGRRGHDEYNEEGSVLNPDVPTTSDREYDLNKPLPPLPAFEISLGGVLIQLFRKSGDPSLREGCM